MTPNTSHTARKSLSMTLLLMLALLPASAGAAHASSLFGLVGAWTVQVTLRDCTTNAPLGPAFNSLVTFHADGTISEAAASLAFAPGQRSPGHGVWSFKRNLTFKQEMISLVLFDTTPNLPGPGFDPSKPVSPGFFAGWVTVSHTVRFTGADAIESTGTNRFYKANGELYRSGCSSATGQRF